MRLLAQLSLALLFTCALYSRALTEACDWWLVCFTYKQCLYVCEQCLAVGSTDRIKRWPGKPRPFIRGATVIIVFFKLSLAKRTILSQAYILSLLSTTIYRFTFTEFLETLTNCSLFRRLCDLTSLYNYGYQIKGPNLLFVFRMHAMNGKRVPPPPRQPREVTHSQHEDLIRYICDCKFTSFFNNI